ncbi:hypothetical protein [Candidatus Deianiraea vastatrix]|uniref:Uncharacterized protein n=1 Tax=Candidatus Deianiraea vastatrix TaxID=2163644 RepID=A0A5B8XG42_9RICK|nr:hypothetical protein [Candidatus Deianiraea vastatrix]QED23211.1 hypothetical protein Deia_00408 [Candidatus Deianiraea vastatrix]
MSGNNGNLDSDNSVVVNIADWSLNKVANGTKTSSRSSCVNIENKDCNSGGRGKLIQFNSKNSKTTECNKLNLFHSSKSFSSISSLKKGSKKNDSK